MSQLIQIRHQIKTVETIRRIANAMRLIARSAHLKLNKQRTALQLYHHCIAKIISFLHTQPIQIAHPESILEQPIKELVILVGANKGLCGNFNNAVFTLFAAHIKDKPLHKISVIPLGKKAVEFLQTNYPSLSIDYTYDYSHSTISTLAQQITNLIHTPSIAYKHVSIISNKTKNFFVHYPNRIQIMPLLELTHTKKSPDLETINSETLIEEPAHFMAQATQLYIYSAIQVALFESYLAEQAARFISMDTATKNADGLLEKTKLKYNKLRQTKITKDLIEIASAF